MYHIIIEIIIYEQKLSFVNTFSLPWLTSVILMLSIHRSLLSFFLLSLFSVKLIQKTACVPRYQYFLYFLSQHGLSKENSLMVESCLTYPFFSYFPKYKENKVLLGDKVKCFVDSIAKFKFKNKQKHMEIKSTVSLKWY